MKRQIYKIKRPGSIKRLRLYEEDLEEPKAEEITVEIKSIGLNFADIFTVLGLYKAAQKTNIIPGLEFSGIVIKKGKDVNDLNIGDKVYGVSKFGSYATYLNIDHNYVIKLPGKWTFDEGASFIVQSLTAYYALVVLGEVSSDKTVLIHSAAGGVGINANRIAKKFSAFTIGTVGDESKLDIVKSEGYDKVIVRSKDLKDKIIRVLDGRQLDIVLDTVGSKVFKTSFSLLSPMGRIIVYGAGAYSTGKASSNYFKLAFKFLTRPKVDPLRMIEQNRAIMAFNLIWLYEKKEYLKNLLNEIIKMNLPKPLISYRYSFNNLPEALIKLKSGTTIGKVVVNTGDKV